RKNDDRDSKQGDQPQTQPLQDCPQYRMHRYANPLMLSSALRLNAKDAIRALLVCHKKFAQDQPAFWRNRQNAEKLIAHWKPRSTCILAEPPKYRKVDRTLETQINLHFGGTAKIQKS